MDSYSPDDCFGFVDRTRGIIDATLDTHNPLFSSGFGTAMRRGSKTNPL